MHRRGISVLRTGPPICVGVARQKQHMTKAKKIAKIGLYLAIASLLAGLTPTLWLIFSTFNALKDQQEIEISQLVPQVSLSLWPMMVALVPAFVGFVLFFTGMCLHWIQRARERQVQNRNSDNG